MIGGFVQGPNWENTDEIPKGNFSSLREQNLEKHELEK